MESRPTSIISAQVPNRAVLHIGRFCRELLSGTGFVVVLLLSCCLNNSLAQIPTGASSGEIRPDATIQAPAPRAGHSASIHTAVWTRDVEDQSSGIRPTSGHPHLHFAADAGRSGQLMLNTLPRTPVAYPPTVAGPIVPQVFGPPALSGAGQTDSFEDDPTLFWWEMDLTRPILRTRPPVEMTLHRALGLAITEAPELQVLHSEWYIQQAETERVAAAFDWSTFVEAIWNRDSTPVSSTLDGAVNRLRSRSLNVSAGLRRLNPNGGVIELSQTTGLRNSNSQFISPNNQATSRISLDLEQPLLRGAGEAYNASPLRLAEIDKETAYDRFQAGIQDHLLRVATAYWTLVLRRGRFLQSIQSWNRAKEIAQEMSGRTQIDVTPNMLDRARSEVAARLSSAVEAEHDVIRSQDSLLRLIYGAEYPDHAENEIITATLPMKQDAAVDPAAQVERALHNRSEVHQVIRQIKAASIRYNVATNELLPALDLVLTSYVAGLHGDNDVSSAFLEQFQQGEPGVGVGLNFEIPYRNRAAKATAERTQAGIRRLKSQLEVALSEVTEDVRNQVIQRNKYGSVLKQRWETLARNRRILSYAATRRELLADGTEVADLYLENLLQMQARLESAEAAYLDSQIRYSLADNALLRATSQLDDVAHMASCNTCPPGPAIAPPAMSGHAFDVGTTVQSPSPHSTRPAYGHTLD